MNTSQPPPAPDPTALNDRVASALMAHRIKIRLLTSVAFLFGFVAVAASVAFVGFYLVFYLPKQKQILREVGIVAQQSSTGAGAESVQDAIQRIDKFVGVQVTMTNVVSMGSTLLAAAVGILGLGTLMLLTVVILSRRVTLRQIHASLARISGQLRELHSNRSIDPPVH